MPARAQHEDMGCAIGERGAKRNRRAQSCIEEALPLIATGGPESMGSVDDARMAARTLTTSVM